MNKALFAALLLVLAASPFEAGYPPLGRFLWATFTNLEILLLLLAATYIANLALDPGARRRALSLPLRWPLLALLGASVLSTLLGEFKSLGVHFIYRLLMGILVYAAAWECLKGRRRALGAAFTFVGAGLVAATLGLLEFAPGVDIQPYLEAFKPQPTTVGGLLRLSGSFEYANGAAMYFEMALPVLVALVMLFSSRVMLAALVGEGAVREGNRRGVAALLYVAVGVYTMALILTLSRAALVGLLVALGVFALALLVRRGAARRTPVCDPPPNLPALRSTVLRSLLVTGGVILIGALTVFASQPMFRLRLLTQNDRDWYRATVVAEALPALAATQVVSVPVMVRNDGQMVWPHAGPLPVHLSYHWMSATDDIYLHFDGLRTALPRDVAPGETTSVHAIVQAPARPGKYRLQWDMVHENVTWFDRKQGMTAEVKAYEITDAPVLAGTDPPATSMPPPVDVQAVSDSASVPRSSLWSAALAMFLDHPITGVGPDGFRHLYGRYAGVSEWNRNIYTNNTYLEMFTNLGLLGGLAFVWLGALALWRTWLGLMRGGLGPMWLLGVGATASLVAFFAHGMVDYFLFSTPIYVIFWFLLASAERWTHLDPHPAVLALESSASRERPEGAVLASRRLDAHHTPSSPKRY